MNDELVEKFDNQIFTQGSAILKNKYYIPKNSIVQPIPIKEREKKIEISLMRNGCIIDTLTSVDIQEIVKVGGEVIQIYEGAIYRENFKISPFRKVIDNIFALRQNNKDEKNVVIQLLVKLLMNFYTEKTYAKILKKNLLVNQKLG